MAKCKHQDLVFTHEQEAKMCGKGLRQSRCPVCLKWFWPCEWDKRKPAKVKTVKAWAWITENGLFHAYELLPNKMTRPFKFELGKKLSKERTGYFTCTITYRVDGKKGKP